MFKVVIENYYEVAKLDIKYISSVILKSLMD